MLLERINLHRELKLLRNKEIQEKALLEEVEKILKEDTER